MTLKESGTDNYLFHSEGLIDFVVIEEELRQLNDYAFFLTEVSQKKLQNTESELDFSYDEEEMLGKDFIEDEKHILQEQMFEWESNVNFITPSMILVLLYFLTEKSLKNLCYSFSEEDGEYSVPVGKRFKIKNKTNESHIEAYFRYLKEKCNFNFLIDKKIISLLYQCNNIRNNFAHGDWENVKDKITKIDLASAFKAISLLFKSIEQGMPKKNG